MILFGAWRRSVKGLVTDAEKRRIHLEGMFEGAVDLVGHFKPIFAVSVARRTCTGCRNGLLSSLFDMRADGTLGRARELTITAGPAAIPVGIPQEE